MKKKRNSLIKVRTGMSLMETVLAVGIVMAVVISSITISLYTTRIGRLSQNKLIGINLAREGIESVRNLRDSNWLYASAGEVNPSTGVTYVWDDGVLGSGLCSGWCTADYTQFDAALDLWNWVYTASGDITSYSDCGPARLNIDSRGLYNHDAGGTQSDFCRVVSINQDASFNIKVISKVLWEEGGRVKKVILEEILTNWRDEL